MGAGEVWKKRREGKGMTLEEAASELRISRKYLRDIEEGQYGGWPARVFSAGYIRAYAKLLSEDAEPVLTEYYKSLEQQAPGEPEGERPTPQWLERERQRGSRRTTYAMATVAVLLVGLLLAWYSSRMTSRPVPAPVAKEVPRPVPPAGDNAASPAVAAGVDNAAPPSPPEAPAAGVAAPSPPRPAVENAAPSPPQSSVASVGAVGPVKSPYQLFLEASELTWLMYSMDDGEPVEAMLYPGDKISLQAQKKIFLKLGNAGGLVGTLNGKLLPPFGARGQVKEFRLGE